LSESSQ